MAKRKPTVLDVYLECLHIIQELAPDDRPRVVRALANCLEFSPKVLTCPESVERVPVSEDDASCCEPPEIQADAPRYSAPCQNPSSSRLPNPR